MLTWYAAAPDTAEDYHGKHGLSCPRARRTNTSPIVRSPKGRQRFKCPPPVRTSCCVRTTSQILRTQNRTPPALQTCRPSSSPGLLPWKARVCALLRPELMMRAISSPGRLIIWCVLISCVVSHRPDWGPCCLSSREMSVSLGTSRAPRTYLCRVSAPINQSINQSIPSQTHVRAAHFGDRSASVYVAPVDTAADMASVLLEAVEAAEGEAPGPAADAVSVCADAGAEVLAAEALVVHERHLVWFFRSGLNLSFVW